MTTVVSMTMLGEGQLCQSYSVITVATKGSGSEGTPEEETSGTVVGYTKSTPSISSADGVAKDKLHDITEGMESEGASAVTFPNQANDTGDMMVKKKHPRVRKSQVDVDNSKVSSVDEAEGRHSLMSKLTAPSLAHNDKDQVSPSVKFSDEFLVDSKADKKDLKFKHRRHMLWYRLRRRHRHMGVVEVDVRHPYYMRLQALSAGMQSVYADPGRPQALDNMHLADYALVQGKELLLEEGTTFLFENYAPAVFATIRRAVSISEEAYMESIISHHMEYLEFISNSRSGQDFFLSANMQYLIKTNKKRDVQFLLSILEQYLQHFLSFPHSLLVKYVGCYSIKLRGEKKVFLLVMQNIFYPPERIEDRFDVKGCTAGRYQKPRNPSTYNGKVQSCLPCCQEPVSNIPIMSSDSRPVESNIQEGGSTKMPYHPDSNTITVLKDQNFFREKLQLGSNSGWFITQITADAAFLQDLNVMDYSLLVGRQKLQETEKGQYCLPDLVSRIARSSKGGSLLSSESQDDLGESMTKLQTIHSRSSVQLSVTDSDKSIALRGQTREATGLQFPRSLTELSGIGCRRRLLLDCSNALHIIDGPEYRYFFGIVDFLTQWTLKQKAARLWKMVKYGCGEHSTMPPRYYCERFVSFICRRVT